MLMFENCVIKCYFFIKTDFFSKNEKYKSLSTSTFRSIRTLTVFFLQLYRFNLLQTLFVFYTVGAVNSFCLPVRFLCSVDQISYTQLSQFHTPEDFLWALDPISYAQSIQLRLHAVNQFRLRSDFLRIVDIILSAQEQICLPVRFLCAVDPIPSPVRFHLPADFKMKIIILFYKCTLYRYFW